MNFAPLSPAVFRADTRTPDGKIVPGPWFSNQLFFNTDREAFLQAIEIVATAQSGVSINYKMDLPLHLVRGVTAHSDVLYFGSLPYSRILTYKVVVHAYGTYLATGDKFDVMGSFLTQ